MILTGQEKEILKDAIINAFREEELEVLLSEKTELSYEAIARGGDCQTRVFNLIQWLETEGRLGEFITAIKNKKPNSPYLKSLPREGFQPQNIGNYAPNAQGSNIIGTQNNYGAGQSSNPQGQGNVNPLSTWNKKLLYLQNQEAIASDPSLKFQLQEQIEECHRKIKELEEQIDSRDPPSNLPSSGTPYFVGRDETLTQVHQQLQESSQLAICAVSGMGGIGKTELAVQYAIRHKDDYTGGLCWLQGRAGDIGSQIVNFGRSLLGLTIPEGIELPYQILYCWQHWKEGQVLLIYDDVTDYQVIAPLLPPRDMSPFKVLLTSRQKLLHEKNRINLDILKPEEALELLRSLVGNALINTELDEAKELCSWLGYLPLAIELVGSYLQLDPFLGVAEAQEQLKESSLNAPLLEDQGLSGSVAQKGVAAAFELSWVKLSPAAQEMGCRLSLFALAPIDWSWVEQCYHGQEIRNKQEREKIRNRELFARNLIQTGKNKKYILHPLIRQFFIIKLQQRTEKNIDHFKRDLCRVMVAIAQQIPQTVTLEVIESTTAYIPHLREVGENLIGWVEDEVLISPFVVLGRIYKGQSQFAEAEKWYKKSVEVTRDRLGERHPDVAASYNNLALLYYTIGRYGEAEPLYEKALEIRLEQLGQRHQYVAASYNNLAALYYAMGRYREAEPLFQKALEIRLEQLGERHPDVAASYNNLAVLYCAMGRYGEAEPLYEKALEIRLEQLGERHPDVAASYNNLDALYCAMGRYGEAEPLYEKALEIRLEQLGERHPDVATSYNNLTGLYCAMGRYGEAEPLLQNALEIMLEQLGERHPDVAAAYHNLAVLYCAMGRYGEAEQLFRKSLALRLEILPKNHPDVMSSYWWLATIAARKRDYPEAIANYQKALDIAQEVFGEEHPNTLGIQNNYLQMLFESPIEEILNALPEEMHENYLKMRSDWEKQKEQG